MKTKLSLLFGIDGHIIVPDACNVVQESVFIFKNLVTYFLAIS